MSSLQHAFEMQRLMDSWRVRITWQIRRRETLLKTLSKREKKIGPLLVKDARGEQLTDAERQQILFFKEDTDLVTEWAEFASSDANRMESFIQNAAHAELMLRGRA